MESLTILARAAAISSVILLLSACSGGTAGSGTGLNTGTGNSGGTGQPAITDNITVDPTSVLSDTVRHPVGINTSWIDDNQAWRAPGSPALPTALGNLGVKYIRFPGGEDSNLYLWSVPPYTGPLPTLALPGPDRNYNQPPVVANSTTPVNPYDFDQFMADCQAIHCTPNIVVALRPYLASAMPNDPVPSRQALIDVAAAWVHYANITKGYGIKQWEIGNEYNVDNSGPSSLGTGPAETTPVYIQDVHDFSVAMKAVDPTIQIGAFAWTASDFLPILQADAPDIDFLVVHSYPFGTTPGQETTGAQYQGMTTISGVEYSINEALNALADPSISPADRARIKISITETNSMLAGDTNTLFDAVSLADLLGQTFTHPQVNYAEVWVDHWYGSLLPSPDGWNSLDNSNNITAKGEAIRIWGQFLSEQMVNAQMISSDSMVRTYSTYNQHTGNLNVVLLNKDSSTHTANILLSNYNVSANSAVTQWILSGASQADTSPTFAAGSALQVNNGSVSAILPGPSVVVLTLEGASANGLNLIADPGFEDSDLSAWPMSSSSTPMLSSVSHSGMQAIQIPSGMGIYQNLPSTGLQGKACTLGGWGMVGSASSSGQAQLAVTGTLNGQPWNEPLTFTSASYAYVLQQFTMPSGLQNPSITISNSTGSIFSLDDLSLTCR